MNNKVGLMRFAGFTILGILNLWVLYTYIPAPWGGLLGVTTLALEVRAFGR